MAICSRAKYRELMGDLTSYDGDVDSSLTDAQSFLEDETERLFELAARTESLVVDIDGYVHPRAVPIASVATPINTTIDGNRVLVGSFLSLGLSPRDTIDTTYTGGYAADALPASLVKLVARIAYGELYEAPDFPCGAKTVKVGDVSYSGDNLGEAVDATLKKAIRKWKRIRVEMY